uniref:Synaptonemal complex central element protein 2 n=1 Tax=Amphilophus citrinellus TaxID=61819 RepID=A0A3Q0RJE2_AMPCI
CQDHVFADSRSFQLQLIFLSNSFSNLHHDACCYHQNLHYNKISSCNQIHSAFFFVYICNVYCSSGIDDISKRAQELVEKINHNRTSDQNMIDSFQEMLIEKVTEMCQQMKEHMYTVYEENSDNMQVKLQELSEVLESCTKLSHELLEASRALASLREGLAISQEIEL